MTRHGFSLIELVVVIVLMAMIAAAASLSLRGYVQRQRVVRAVETIGRFDAALRSEARRTRSTVTGTIEPSGGRLMFQSEAETRVFKLPADVRLNRVRIGPITSSTSPRRLAVDDLGRSPSYAIEVVAGTASRWVFFSGASGQGVNGLDRDEVTALLGTS